MAPTRHRLKHQSGRAVPSIEGRHRASGETLSPRREIADLSVEPVSRGTLRQQVTARLMTGIFQGRFGSGQRLIVQDLARAYHASPTPVREALVELASLGLVDLLPNRGAVVQPF